MVRKLNENANSLKDQIYAFLDDEGMYTDYNQKIEDVMDNFSLSREDAESFVWSHASGVEGTGLYNEENYLYNESTIKENDYSETDEFTLIKEMNHWIKDLKKFFVDDSNAQKAIADYFYYDDGAHQEDFKELQASVKTLRKLYNKLDNIVEDVEEKEYTKNNKKESLSLKEQDVEIEVKHEGILEVPEGKNVDELPIKHFVALANKKGLSKITKALNNLQVWNKNKDPKLSKWAGDMIDKVTKRVENQKESFIRESNLTKSYWKYNQFDDNLDETEYYDKYTIKRIRLIPCRSAEECYNDNGSRFSAWAVTELEYPYKEVYCTKDEAYEYLMDYLNHGRYEQIHDL